MSIEKKIEKILVGDDQIQFAKGRFPYIPFAEIEFVSDPDELIQKASTGDYSLIVTDLNYTESGEEGYGVLEALKDVAARKILWTGNAYDPGVRERGESLGAEVLDKDEIDSLVGQVVSKAPLKKDGKIFVYVLKESGSAVQAALEKVTDALFGVGGEVVVGSDLKAQLSTGQYGLVIDTSAALNFEKRAGVVAHDMKYIKLDEVPRVATVHSIATLVEDIHGIVKDYLSAK